MGDQSEPSQGSAAGKLARRIMEGDKIAESQFYEKYFRWLVFIIRKRYVSSPWVEDIAQEAFMVAIISLTEGKVENPNRILGFLKTTAIRIANRSVAREGKQLPLDPQIMSEIEASPDNVASLAEWQDLLECAKQCIKELNVPRDQEIIRRYFVLGQDKADICRDLRLDLNHFDRVLFRAKQRLRKLFRKRHHDGSES
ncbi:MAG: sigma-70 family RNA polymerase sigma factor [Pseudomonadota bacterium]